MVIAVASLGLAYVAVPKAGSSSVKAMLAEIDPDISLKQEHHYKNRKFHAIYPTRRYFKHRLEGCANAFKFTVVRDPIKRLMSVYTNRVKQKRDLEKSTTALARAELPLNPDPDFFFQNLRRYAHNSRLIRHHVNEVSRFTGKDLKKYDQVYRTDQIGDLAQFLSVKAGRDINVAKANSSGEKLNFEDLKPKTQRKLMPLLKAEYEFLADYYENPLN